MVLRAFGPQPSPVSTTMRAVKGSRADAAMKESRWGFAICVPGAWHLHWMAQQPPRRSSATRSMPVSAPSKSGRAAAHSDQSRTLEKRSR